jgi:hypothetical protein
MQKALAEAMSTGLCEKPAFRILIDAIEAYGSAFEEFLLRHPRGLTRTISRTPPYA